MDAIMESFIVMVQMLPEHTLLESLEKALSDYREVTYYIFQRKECMTY
jgi:hypothetical protein